MRFLLTALLLLTLGSLVAAVGCDLNDPDRDVKRLFPGSTSYKAEYGSIKEKGGATLLRQVETRLGDTFTGQYETAEAPYTFYRVYKGMELDGYIHGVNQKGKYGGIQVFLALDTKGVIKTFYIQKLTAAYGKDFRAESFAKQFFGLSLADFSSYDPKTGKVTGKVAAIKNPNPTGADDFKAILRGVKKNLILVDVFLIHPTGK
jgi:hypothetical protein